MSADPHSGQVRVVGRYAIYDAIASGGMATVHLGRMMGPERFSRTVAIKRLHDAYFADPEFVAMFIDEARLAARVRHPNVLQTLDLVTADNELLLVFEYVRGQTLAQLLEYAAQNQARIPHRIVASIMSGVLQGLHAAHDARDEYGQPLRLVHRDVSPQNVMVGLDGVARVLDFGVAKAEGRLQETRDGQVKGKLGYIAPEQIEIGQVTPRTDVYSAGVVTWEALTGKRLVPADTPAMMVARMLLPQVVPPSRIVPGLPSAYDDVVLRAIARDPAARFRSAREMALALEACDGVESNAAVSVWLERLLGAAVGDMDATEVMANKDAISGVQTLKRPIRVEDEIDWDELEPYDEPLEIVDDDALTLTGEPPTLELAPTAALLDARARAELLSASDYELTEPKNPRSQPEWAPAPAKPSTLTAQPNLVPPPKPAQLRTQERAAPRETPRRRSRALSTFAWFLLISGAAAGATYYFRDRLPWVAAINQLPLPSFLRTGSVTPAAEPSTTASPEEALPDAAPSASPSASASASVSASTSTSASALPPPAVTTSKPARRTKSPWTTTKKKSTK